METMLDDLSKVMTNPPDIWGEGALFAFSGMDGQTEAATGFVASLGADPCDLLIHTPRRRVLELRVGEQVKPRVITGDVISLKADDGELLMVWTSRHTMVADVPQGAEANLRFEDGTPAERTADRWLCTDDAAGDAVALARDGNRLALSFGRSGQQAQQRAEDGLRCDPAEHARKRLSAFEKLPKMDDPARARLLAKCFSVMKVNTLSAEGVIRQHWSTPDRVPHRDMWLWDSVFHSLGMNHFDEDLSWEFLKSILDCQQPDGRIPGQVGVAGKESLSTQPPLLAWGVWENYLTRGGTDALEYALPRLEAYVEWDCANRDSNGNGLLEWQIDSSPFCRSGESGLDNSPRFDEAVDLEAVDFSVFMAREMLFISRICGELGLEDKSAEWLRRSRRISAAVHDLLWSEQDGFYYDRKLDGELTGIKAVTGFLPLLLEDLPTGRARRLTGHLDDPDEFATALPVPSVAVSHPAFSTDMWRGPTWVNLNAMVVRGLRRHGLDEYADRIVDATIEHVRKYYEQYGVIFEFFDSTDRVPPPACDRKGPQRGHYNIREKFDSIRDYHWSAALTAEMLLSDEGDRKS
ncbi:MAG: amylo-alpha-1,6-glucosidase [Phycisphaerae bacterium]